MEYSFILGADRLDESAPGIRLKAIRDGIQD